MGLVDTVHPNRIAACFRGPVPDGLVENLIGTPRFSSRLSQLLGRQYDVQDDREALSEPDETIARLELDELEALAFRVGVVVRADDFVRDIQGSVIAALAERFGTEALQTARVYRDLAMAREPITDLEALDAAVRADGNSCLAAWIAEQPKPVARHVMLKWPDDDAVPKISDQEFLGQGATILRSLVSNTTPDQ